MAISPEQLAKSGTEHGHQAALFLWSALNKNQYPQLQWLFAVPNGFYSDSGQKAKMKAEGLRDGAPDVWLPYPLYDHNAANQIKYAGLVIEMKIEKYRNSKNGGCSEEQLKWLEYLIKMRYRAIVCYSWEEARDRILEYING